MLTSPLVRVRRVGDEIVPRYLGRAPRARLGPVAAELCAIMADAQGLRREQLEARLDIIESSPTDAKVVAGLRKLLLDRAQFELESGTDPVALREQLFTRTAACRRALGPTEHFDRTAVTSEVAGELGIDEHMIEERLFADLAGNERLVAYRPITPEALLDRYDLALAQAVLLSAARVTVTLEAESAKRVRALFRAARFHGLIHRVTAEADGYRVVLDGPLSLFSSVQRYGLRLALFLPAVLECEHWSLEAELRWGRARESLRFRLAPRQGLVAPRASARSGISAELVDLVEGFRALASRWTVTTADRIFALPGHAVCVPDLTFSHRDTGEVVYLELFGFWSRTAVWQRIEAVRAGLDARMILCVGKQLRVSEELLDEGDASELYVYRARPSPRAVLERLERPHVTGA